MKILVPIDGSKTSEKALEYAIKLQKKLLPGADKEIIILNVLTPFQVHLGFERPMKSLKTDKIISLTNFIEEMNETLKKEWVDNLSDIKKKYETQDVKIKTMIIEGSGSVADNIISFADKENANIIVIGNIGLSGISKIKTLGSVSRKVSELSKCPVLIIH
ncbi:MAG TPA: universal stress protein [Verrucomicrobiae bacterium]|nr:universal stress protein [Verrucomicrobiae bacterium]